MKDSEELLPRNFERSLVRSHTGQNTFHWSDLVTWLYFTAREAGRWSLTCPGGQGPGRPGRRERTPEAWAVLKFVIPEPSHIGQYSQWDSFHILTRINKPKNNEYFKISPSF